jgi:hypothetical protein
MYHSIKSNRKSQEQFGLLIWITPAGVNKPYIILEFGSNLELTLLFPIL